MKRFLLALAVLVCSCSESYTFIHYSDAQLGFYEKPYGEFARTKAQFEAAVARFHEFAPDMVFDTGDFCDQSGHEGQNAAYKAIRESIEYPVYAVPGNHDIQDGYTPEKHALFLEKYGYDRFAFRHKGDAFIGFDSNPARDNYQPDEAEVFAWLEKQLRKYSGARHIFLFYHCPVIYGAPDQ